MATTLTHEREREGKILAFHVVPPRICVHLHYLASCACVWEEVKLELTKSQPTQYGNAPNLVCVLSGCSSFDPWLVLGW